MSETAGDMSLARKMRLVAQLPEPPEPVPHGLVRVFHGCPAQFADAIREAGLEIRRGSAGIRCSDSYTQAVAHSMAWSAHLMAAEAAVPRGTVFYADVARDRIASQSDADRALGIVRLPRGIRKWELHQWKTLEFKELYKPDVALRAIQLFERITDSKLTRERNVPRG